MSSDVVSSCVACLDVRQDLQNMLLEQGFEVQEDSRESDVGDESCCARKGNRARGRTGLDNSEHDLVQGMEAVLHSGGRCTILLSSQIYLLCFSLTVPFPCCFFRSWLVSTLPMDSSLDPDS